MESWTWRVFPVKLYKNSFLWKYFYSPCIQPFLMKYLDESREWLKKKKSRVMIAEKDNHDFGTMGEKNKTSVSGRHWGGALIIFVLHNCSWNCSPFLEEKASCAAFQASGNVLIQTNHGAGSETAWGAPALMLFKQNTLLRWVNCCHSQTKLKLSSCSPSKTNDSTKFFQRKRKS